MANINKDQFYSETRWDVGLNDEIPEQIEITFKEGSLNKASGRKYVLRTASYFRVLAFLSGEYETIDLREQTISE